MARGGREHRIGQEVQRLLPELIRRELKDPGVTGLITLTAVEVTRDLKHAKVYVTRLGDAAGLPDTLRALNRSAAFLRGALARKMTIRAVPELHFVFDASVERGVQLTRLIEEAVATGANKAGVDAPDGAC